MNRVAEIADYLLSTGIGDTEAAWKAEVLETIAARWPDVGEAELTAAFQIVIVETAADLARALAKRVEADAPHTDRRCCDGR
ncbi:hypothetical protein LOK46_25575 [Methylobacterium sp. NMS14P]|uniref:hypothetical protein n=1 Tax=Methylobacterium sp. NMS14P TaxID=2894310 RepID=UPI0023589187|nr:hypothetical protein [Methylobacterium sp. NMS14P]WCS24465.1 hypothetical protein LOK46_25575 [Methylobacterium sp. NMS14P]